MIWLVAFCSPSQDYIADKFIQSLNYETLFLKTAAKPPRTDGVPLFPRYLFVGMEALTGARDIRRAHGVQHVLKDADGPLTVPEGVIEELKSRIGPDGLVPMTPALALAKRELYAAGDRVRFNSGPFQGLLATVKLDNTKEIQLDMDGRPVTTPQEFVSPVLRDASLNSQ